MKIPPYSRVLLAGVVLFSITSLAVAYEIQMERERSVPIGTRLIFEVEALPSNLSKAQLIQAIQEAARLEETNVYKVEPSRSDPENSRVLYEFVGDSTSLVGGSGRHYPSFNSLFKTTIQAADSIVNEDLRGSYAIYGNQSRAERLASDLKKIGLLGQVRTVPEADVFSQVIIGKNPVLAVLAVNVLGVFLGGITLTLRRWTIASMRQSIGKSHFKIACFDLGATAFSYLVASVPFGLLTILLVAIFAGFEQAGPFGLTYLLLSLIGAATAVTGVTACHLKFAQVGFERSIRAGWPNRMLSSTSILTVAISFVAALGALGNCVTLASTSVHEGRMDKSWQAAGSSVVLRFAPTASEEDFSLFASKFRGLVSEFEARREFVLSKPPTSVSPLRENYSPFEGNSLVINTVFLERNNVFASDGKLVHSPKLNSGQMILLIPSGLWSERARMKSEFLEWAQFQNSISNRSKAEIEISLVEISSASEVFNYGANNFSRGSSQSAPVIAVIDASSEILSSDFYVTAASNAAAIFSNPSSVDEGLKALGIDGIVASIDLANARAFHQRSERFAEFVKLSYYISLLLIALMLSTIVLTESYFERNRSAIGIRLLNGHGFLSRHLHFLTTILVAGIAALAINSQFGLTISIFSITLAFSLTIAFCSVVLFLLTLKERQFFRTQNNSQFKLIMERS